MWTSKDRARYERKGLRYESDLTDEEYALFEPFLPPERSVCRRSLVNAILYVLTTGLPVATDAQGLSPEMHDA